MRSRRSDSLLVVVPVEGRLVHFDDCVGGIGIDIFAVERRLFVFADGVGGIGIDIVAVERGFFVTTPRVVGRVDVDVVSGKGGRMFRRSRRGAAARFGSRVCAGISHAS